CRCPTGRRPHRIRTTGSASNAPAGPAYRSGFQATSGRPAPWLAARASTKSRSESRFTYLRTSGLTGSRAASRTICRSALRATVRAWCSAAAARHPHHGVQFVDRPVGADAKIVLRDALPPEKGGFPRVPGPGADARHRARLVVGERPLTTTGRRCARVPGGSQVGAEPGHDVPEPLEPVFRLPAAREVVALAGKPHEQRRRALFLERDEELLPLFDRAPEVVLAVEDEQ